MKRFVWFSMTLPVPIKVFDGLMAFSFVEACVGQKLWVLTIWVEKEPSLYLGDEIGAVPVRRGTVMNTMPVYGYQTFGTILRFRIFILLSHF